MMQALRCLGIVAAVSGWVWARPIVSTVKMFAGPEATRISIQTGEEVEFKAVRMREGKLRIYFDLQAPLGAKRALTIEGEGPLIERVRVAANQPNVTRVVFDLTREIDFQTEHLKNPGRLVIEMRAKGTKPAAMKEPEPTVSRRTVPAEVDKPVSSGKRKPARTLVIADATRLYGPPLLLDPVPLSGDPTAESRRSLTRSTPMLAKITAPPPLQDRIEPGVVKGKAQPDNALPSRPITANRTLPAAKLSNGQSSMTRVLGLKLRRIVIDAGHGGHDEGASGPGGLKEKDVVLDVSLRLGELVKQRLRAEVVYVREEDRFVDLHDRTRVANRSDGDLFISVHANASPDPKAAGVETYYLNFADARDAMEVAARENASGTQTVRELNDLVAKIAKNDKLQESREFATYVQNSLHTTATKLAGRPSNRGVKKAQFVVLIGARMPSILAEIGFITNPQEEARLKKGEYRQKIAEALFQGIVRYSETLSRVQVVRND